MTTNDNVDYSAFVGTWVLDPASCEYDQGEAPQAGRYHIAERGGRVHFLIDWTDAVGQQHHTEFSGVPNGAREPLPGDPDLANALAVTCVSPRELNSSAYSDSRLLMVAQRQLDDTGTVMRVTQQVHLLDGTRPTNVSLYHKRLPN